LKRKSHPSQPENRNKKFATDLRDQAESNIEYNDEDRDEYDAGLLERVEEAQLQEKADIL
ncbi:2643_t:CDS:1, partial [Paraglomus brasilianum]